MLFDARPFESLRGERCGCPVQDQRQPCADADAVEAADQKIAPRTGTFA